MWLVSMAWEWLTTDWNANKVADVIKIIITIVGGGWGIYKTWRFAEGRLYERLIEYLQREEERLKNARIQIVGAIRKSLPGKPSPRPIFSNIELNKALRQLKWGKADKAAASLNRVLSLIDGKIVAAKGQTRLHQKQKAAAHLLLGAIADSKSQHAIALDHFEKALEVDPDDLEALEYAGQQLLKLPNALRAFDYFKRLQEKAEQKGNSLLVARSLRYQAEACVALPKPELGTANSLLLQIVRNFPKEMSSLERARIHEFHARVRSDLGYQNANESYTEALTIYAQLEAQTKSRDASEGVRRITSEIARLNQTGSLPSGDEARYSEDRPREAMQLPSATRTTGPPTNE